MKGMRILLGLLLTLLFDYGFILVLVLMDWVNGPHFWMTPAMLLLLYYFLPFNLLLGKRKPSKCNEKRMAIS